MPGVYLYCVMHSSKKEGQLRVIQNVFNIDFVDLNQMTAHTHTHTYTHHLWLSDAVGHLIQ